MLSWGPVVAGTLTLAVLAELLSSPQVRNPLADGAVAVTLVVGGYAGPRGRPDSRTGPLLLLAGTTWLAGTVAWPAAFWHPAPLVHAYLGYPTGRLRRRLSLLVVAATLPPLSLVPRLASAPRSPWPSPARWRSRQFMPTSPHPVQPSVPGAAYALIATMVYAAMLAILVIQRWRGWGGTDMALYAYDLVISRGASAALVVDLLRARWSEGTAADLVVTLGERASAAALRDVLARAFGDPTLTIAYWVPEQGRYVADDGTPVKLRRTIDGRSTIRVSGC